MADQWHPNAAGYAIIGAQWFSALKPLLLGAVHSRAACCHACCTVDVIRSRHRAKSHWWLLLLLVGCTTGFRHGRATRDDATRRAPPREAGLYAADEALRDAASGAWDYLGTGKWPGINRMYACAFRNARVFIVNVYCGIKDPRAIRIDVYSPTRGRVSIYAEAKSAISALRRPDYFTFMAETAPTPPAHSGVPPLTLAMSFAQLHDYEQRRYDAFSPACYGGHERGKPRSGCLDALAPLEPMWTQKNRLFLEQASDTWYRIVREMRVAAARYGREPG